MAYEVVMPYHLHMPSYFLETFTEYPYYYYLPGFTPVKASILGPDSSIVRGRRMKENSQDSFIIPRSVWPSDHKALVVEFTYGKVGST